MYSYTNTDGYHDGNESFAKLLEAIQEADPKIVKRAFLEIAKKIKGEGKQGVPLARDSQRTPGWLPATADLHYLINFMANQVAISDHILLRVKNKCLRDRKSEYFDPDSQKRLVAAIKLFDLAFAYRRKVIREGYIGRADFSIDLAMGQRVGGALQEYGLRHLSAATEQKVEAEVFKNGARRAKKSPTKFFQKLVKSPWFKVKVK